MCGSWFFYFRKNAKNPPFCVICRIQTGTVVGCRSLFCYELCNYLPMKCPFVCWLAISHSGWRDYMIYWRTWTASEFLKNQKPLFPIFLCQHRWCISQHDAGWMLAAATLLLIFESGWLVKVFFFRSKSSLFRSKSSLFRSKSLLFRGRKLLLANATRPLVPACPGQWAAAQLLQGGAEEQQLLQGGAEEQAFL